MSFIPVQLKIQHRTTVFKHVDEPRAAAYGVARTPCICHLRLCHNTLRECVRLKRKMRFSNGMAILSK